MSILDSIKCPDDVKALNDDELRVLCLEIRQRIINVTSKNGGHVGPNLGVVELTLALHKVFDSPTDRFIFDVSHQGYVHKLLTGRNNGQFDNLRKTDGTSGFLSRSESSHDCYGAGHAGTALSAALGMAVARDKMRKKDHIVAIIGDAALTCGITMEALNNIAVSTNRLIVVLNDNEWSISKNVGAISKYLNELITNKAYNRFHDDLKSFLNKMPGGDSIINFASKAKKEAKDFLVHSSLFEKYDLRYLGPIDGHDLDVLVQYLTFAKQSDRPVLLHVMTVKGNGYEAAINHPEKFHGTSPFEIKTGKSLGSSGAPPKYQDVFGDAIVNFAEKDKSIIGITAAMPGGTGLIKLQEKIPNQFYDVGIAEEHAVLFAAGLATYGMKPVVTIYSTFLQRAIDPIIHDVCIQKLPVVFCMDRAGLSPNDGATHHGLFDIAYLRCVPETIIMQPKDEDELVDMMWTSINTEQPTFIRYPRGSAEGIEIKLKPQKIKIGEAETLCSGKNIIIWALGPWINDALLLAEKLTKENGISVGVVNARFAKPIDKTLLIRNVQDCALIVTMEDHVLSGGFGSAILETLEENEIAAKVLRIGWPDNFVSHGSSVDDLRKANGIDSNSVFNLVLNRYKKISDKQSNYSNQPIVEDVVSSLG